MYLHYILTSKHMPLIHLSKGLLYCSYFILILFLIIIIHYHHLFTPHSSSSSTSCPAILFQWMWGYTNISVPRFKHYLCCPSNWVQSISIRHDNTTYKTITSLCVYCSVYLLYSITVILIYPDLNMSGPLHTYWRRLAYYSMRYSQVISIPPHPLLYAMLSQPCVSHWGSGYQPYC